MVEGHLFREREVYKSTALAVAWAVNFAFADEDQSAKMLKALGVNIEDTTGKDEAATEERRAASRKLLHKIETAQIAHSHSLSVKEFAKGNNTIR